MHFIKYPKTLALERLKVNDVCYPLPIPAGRCLVVGEKMNEYTTGLEL